MLSWFHDHHRRALLETPFPVEWLAYLQSNVAYYALLNLSEQAKLRDDLRILIADKHWEGCGGLDMTPEIQVTVAAQACLLILGQLGMEFTAVESILVYPAGYVASERRFIGSSAYAPVVEEPDPRLGQADSRGTVLLAWDDVLNGGHHPGSGSNLVLHEFAHTLDFAEGDANGVPRIPDDLLDEWSDVMTTEFNALVQATHQSRPTLISAYGATNAAEFFAVVTECFFGQPIALRHTHPRLYKLLSHYYHQDTAARFEAASKIP